MFTRKFFIGGAGAFGAMGAFGGARFFAAAPGRFGGGKPNVRVGIITDIHVRFDGKTGRMTGFASDKAYVHALEWFRDRNVDAVMIAGDMADQGMIIELKCVAEDWFKVFPDDKAPDGHRVERIFVFGNHDWDVFKPYSRYGAKDESELPAHVVSGNYRLHWRNFFHEDFSRVFLKTVKGYSFIGAHWMLEKDETPGNRYACTECYFAEHGKELDHSRPFFYVQHPHPKGTVYPFTRFHDGGAATRALSPFPNAIAITGHSHYSLTDERGIWQGGFTSIGAGCMRFAEPPRDANPPAGYANTRAKFELEKYDTDKLMPLQWPDWTGHQCMLMDIYDDRVVFARHDVMNDLPLADDWVVPLGEAKPYEHAKRAAEMPAPQFRKNARLKVERVRAKTRGRNPDHSDAVEKDAVMVTVPQADAVPGARPVVYEMAALHAGGRKDFLPALDCGCTHSPKNAKMQKPLEWKIDATEMPAGKFRLEVTPVGWFGAKGRPIVSDDPALAPA